MSTQCTDCGRRIDEMDAFPKGRCLDCHAAAPEIQHQTRTMTAEKLARMWGGK